MKRLLMALGLGLVFVCQAFAGEHAALARVTVYWPGEGSGANAAWNGARLNEGHCAVDPKKIPYGSKVVFHDAECLAVDSGPDVVNRKAARLCGRSAAEREAIVIDRFFYTKQRALAWVKAHPHFMTVRVRTSDIKEGTNFVGAKNPRSSPTNIANSATTSWGRRSNGYDPINNRVDLISDMLPFGRLWYGETNTIGIAIDYVARN
jgi:hypothetical protein